MRRHYRVIAEPRSKPRDGPCLCIDALPRDILEGTSFQPILGPVMAALRRASGRGLHILVRLVRSFAQRSLNLTTALPVVKKQRSYVPCGRAARVPIRPELPLLAISAGGEGDTCLIPRNGDSM